MSEANDFLFYSEVGQHLFIVRDSSPGAVMRYDPGLDEEVDASRQEIVDLFVGRVNSRSECEEELSAEKRYRRRKWLQKNTSEFVQDQNETATKAITADSHIKRVSCDDLKTDLKHVSEYRCGSVVLPGKYNDMGGFARSVLLSARLEFSDCENCEKANVSVIGVIAPAILFQNHELRTRSLVLMSALVTEYAKINSEGVR